MLSRSCLGTLCSASALGDHALKDGMEHWHGRWMQEVLRASPHVLELDISHNGMNDGEFLMVVEGMWAPQCHLKVLNITRNKLTANSVRLLLPHCCAGALNSRTSDGPWNSASDAEALPVPPPGQRLLPGGVQGRTISRSPTCSPLQLTHLNLSDNPLGDHALRLLSDAVCQGNAKCQLHTLVVRCCPCCLCFRLCARLSAV
jgi:hypothetical protein